MTALYFGEVLANAERATNPVECRSNRPRGRYQSAFAVGVLIQAL
jgi:hypothetical protein